MFKKRNKVIPEYKLHTWPNYAKNTPRSLIFFAYVLHNQEMLQEHDKNINIFIGVDL